MKENDHGLNFWAGNAILGLALLVLLLMGRLWEHLGELALGLWVALVVAGVYLIMTDKGG